MWEIWQDFYYCEIQGKSNRVKLSIDCSGTKKQTQIPVVAAPLTGTAIVKREHRWKNSVRKAGMTMDQSTPLSFLYTSSFVKLASNISSPPTHFSGIERHISQWLLFMRPPPRHLCRTSFTDIYWEGTKRQRMENGSWKGVGLCLCDLVSCVYESEKVRN